MAINFKGTGAIIVYSVATLGILAIIGYNYWGWFGGKNKHPLGANGAPFPQNPKVGDTFTYGGIKYTFTCAKTPVQTANQPCNGRWMTDKEIQDNNMIERTISPQQNQTQSSERMAIQYPIHNPLIWKWDSVTNPFGHTFEFSGQNPIPPHTSNTVYVRVLSGTGTPTP